MRTYFFKVAFRNITRNKGFSAINIGGLAIGMAAAMLILLWIGDEMSYDKFHVNKKRIYEVWNRVPGEGTITTSNSLPAPGAKVIVKDVPEVERAVRIDQQNNVLFAVDDKKIMRTGFLVDTGFLQMFTFPLINGDPTKALTDMHSIVLTASSAKALFGDGDPMGKMVRVKNEENFVVSAIAQDPPEHSNFKFDYLINWSNKKYGEGQDLGWDDNSTNTFVLLKANVDPEAANNKIRLLKQKYHADSKNIKWEWFLYPLDRLHLYGSFTNGVEDNGGRILFVKLFGIIAAFILLIACINFMNLSTARSEKRAKEVGVRKVIGAGRYSLVRQFIGESILIAAIAGLIAIVVAEITMPLYNQLTRKNLAFDYTNIQTWLFIAAFILFTGLIAGSYPAFFLSSFRPARVLKGAAGKVNALVTPRKVLVVLQFSFAIILIISTIIVKQQIDHGQSRNLGYNKDHLIFHFMTGDIPKNFDLIKNELISSGAALSITRTNSPMTERWSDGWGQNWDGKDPNDRTSFNRMLADEGLGTTAGLQFVMGRDLDLKTFSTDSTGLIINEAALRVMKLKDPLGKKVSDLGIEWHIVGVVKDFILTNPYKPTGPLLICGAKSMFMKFQVVNIKMNGKNAVAANLEKTAAIFRKFNPQYPFEYRFVDEAYARKFDNEKQQGTLAAVFAGLTIFISCLGLFGLAACMAENRIKEIGVRKVLGASVAGITTLLSKDFVKLVIISFFIAAPIAYWGMDLWLQQYDYKVAVRPWVFLVTCVGSVLIALLTVSYQSIRAAIANPIKSLRSE